MCDWGVEKRRKGQGKLRVNEMEEDWRGGRGQYKWFLRGERGGQRAVEELNEGIRGCEETYLISCLLCEYAVKYC